MVKRMRIKPNKIQSIAIGIVLTGVILLFIGSYFLAASEPSLQTFVFHLSTSLLILGSVIIVFEVYLRNDALETVETIFSRQISILDLKIDAYLENGDKLLKKASDNRIAELFSRRSEANKRIVETLHLQIKEKKLPLGIDLLGISLKDFIRHDCGCPERSLSETFNEIISSLVDPVSLKTWSLQPGSDLFCEEDHLPIEAFIRIMVLYPFSKTAVLRICQEESSFEKVCSNEEGVNVKIINNTRLYNDVQNTLKFFHEFFEAHPKTEIPTKVRIKVRLCTFNPMIYSVIINDDVFHEGYHLGKIINDKYIGGKSLIIHYKSGVQSEIIKNHFDHLWEHPTTIKFEDAIIPPDISKNQPLRIKTPDELDVHYQESIKKYSL